jgi:glucuronate isomerase
MLHPDRLFPPDPSLRALTRSLYEAVRELPILSPHGHVPAQVLAGDEPFGDPTGLLITPDHYVTRMLHAEGVPLDRLGVGRGPLAEPDSREAWRLFCERWPLFRGTPSRYWLESELAAIFGVDQTLSARTADVVYDQIAERLAEPEFRPRALFHRFGIEVLATTDDPADDLAAHQALRDDQNFTGRVVPAFRPDRYLEPGRDDWVGSIRRLAAVADVDTGDYDGYVEALATRRRYFAQNGATSADHAHADVRTDPLDPADAARIYRTALEGKATADETTAFRRHMLLEMARMSCEDGLVMTLHPGVRRNHHTATYERFGPDTGDDIPVTIEFTDALRPLLERYGTADGFHLVLFTVDETVFSREIAPLAGFYPSVYAGAPWWFLDAPDAIRRYRAAVTETAGFSRTAGFVDDTRAYCSIPARHDMSRRLDCGWLAGLVAEHRLAEDEAFEVATDLVATNPRKVFKL